MSVDLNWACANQCVPLLELNGLFIYFIVFFFFFHCQTQAIKAFPFIMQGRYQCWEYELHGVPVELNERYSSPVDFEKQIVSKYLCLPENNLEVNDKNASYGKGIPARNDDALQKFADEVLSV